MGNGLIHQHKLLAEGKDVDVGDTGCCSPFMGRAIHGGEEISKKKAVSDNKRGMAHLNKHADHGDHQMAVAKDGQAWPK